MLNDPLAEEEREYKANLEAFQNQVFSVCSALGGFEQALEPNQPLSPSSGADLPTAGVSLKYLMGDECMECLRDLKRYIREDDTNPARHVLGWLGDWSILQRDLLPIFILNAENLLKTADAYTAAKNLLASKKPSGLATGDSESNDGDAGAADDGGGSLKPSLLSSGATTTRNFNFCMMTIELFVVLTWFLSSEERREASWFERALCSYKMAFATHPTALNILLRLLQHCLTITQAYTSTSVAAKENLMVNGILILFRNLLEIPDPHVSISASGELLAHGKLQEILIEKFHSTTVFQLIARFAASAGQKEYTKFNLIIHDIIYLLLKDVQPQQLFRNLADIEGDRISHRLQAEKKLQTLKPTTRRSSRHSRFGGTFVVRGKNGQVMSVLNSQTVTQPLDTSLNSNKKSNVRVRPPKSESLEKTRHPFQDRHTFTILGDLIKLLLRSTAFGPLFTAVGRDIELRRPFIKPQDALRHLYLTAFSISSVVLLNDQQASADADPRRFEYPFSLQDPPEALPAVAEDPEPATDTIAIVASNPLADQYPFNLVETVMTLPHVGMVIRTLRTFLEDKQATSAQVAVWSFKQLMSAYIYISNHSSIEPRTAVDAIFRGLCYEVSTLELLTSLARDPAIPQMDQNHEKHLVIRKKEKPRKKSRKATKDPTTDDKPPVKDGDDVEANPDPDPESEHSEEERLPIYVEREFDLESCERDLARESVVRNYCRLLANYRDHSSTSIYWIVTMLHRIGVKLGYEGLFFKLSVLELFNGILQDQKNIKMYESLEKPTSLVNPTPFTWTYKERNEMVTRPVSAWSALVYFIQDITRQFLFRLQSDPLEYIEVLFSRGRADCLRPDMLEARKREARLPKPESIPIREPELAPAFVDSPEEVDHYNLSD
ncbi:timeless protein-domain-containing protein [Dimargaris cristalligena]|uniref:Timeless protein-domain-containing protein n=1 Tax=Dimargaris cristalligena TaxID=215637 RepID=A0A4P9ZQH9_9FUNG|nr:timeless protein-domain-containing protein [Dimargaris cristalligena]|eukprot:RKP34660.1 timeless protein-domain-containing protein [Dimargaris cristalligena]